MKTKKQGSQEKVQYLGMKLIYLISHRQEKE